MIIQREPEEVSTWLLAFQRDTRHWWMRWLPGEFKHVFAFQWSPRVLAWVVYDVSLSHTRMILLPGGQGALDQLAAWTAGGAILKIEARADAAIRFRIGFWCTIAMKHLIGLRSGALLPTALWRDCLRNGAQIIDYGKPVQTQDAGPRSFAGAGAATAGGAASATAEYGHCR